MEDAECSKDIRGKLAKGMSTGVELKQNLWKSHSRKLTTKLRLMKALVWPVATYRPHAGLCSESKKARETKDAMD